MSELTEERNHAGMVVGWLISAIVIFAIGYSYGSGSKQPDLDAKSNQITVLQQQVDSLKSQQNAATPSSGTTVTPIFNDEPDSTCEVTLCNDGSCSYSTGRGTCSYHGGVAY